MPRPATIPRNRKRCKVQAEPRGERLIGHAPEGHHRTITFVAGLRPESDGAMNGPMFVGYVEQILVPTLKRGDIVIMDNLSVHKVAGVREAIEAARAHVLYLPPYSARLEPSCNGI
jgi:hypothetical protein